MDRRRFLAAGGLAAAAPVVARAAPWGHGTRSAPVARVDFTTDGLGLAPAEYAQRLQQATANSAVEADSYSNGGAIAHLERTFAALLGKPAAIYLPTGTLANHLAVRRLAGAHRRVLVQADSHLYNDSGDCASTLSALNLVPLSAGHPAMDPAEVEHWLARTARGRVEMQVGAISIESPVRRHDHRAVPFETLERIALLARAHGVGLHLDGARLFNLPLHTGRSVRDYAALFDTVYVSVWKHFNAASGAILAGESELIDGMFHVRRMFGGSLPQAWPLVAAVADYAPRYEADYARAWQAAEAWSALLTQRGAFTVRQLPDGTSRLYVGAPGIAGEGFASRLLARGIVLPGMPADAAELPLQVNPTLLRTTPQALADAFHAALTG